MLRGTGPAVREEEEEGEEEGHRALSSLVGWDGKERNLAIAETALQGSDSGGKEIGLQPGGRSGTMCRLWAKSRGHCSRVAPGVRDKFVSLMSPPRLSHTKAAVKAALADDFDTPGAVDAIMDLIHHGNRQLQLVTKVRPRMRPQRRVFVWLVFPHKEQTPPPQVCGDFTSQLVVSRPLLTNFP